MVSCEGCKVLSFFLIQIKRKEDKRLMARAVIFGLKGLGISALPLG